jgi:hypothetical protein
VRANILEPKIVKTTAHFGLGLEIRNYDIYNCQLAPSEGSEGLVDVGVQGVGVGWRSRSMAENLKQQLFQI